LAKKQLIMHATLRVAATSVVFYMLYKRRREAYTGWPRK